MDQENQIQALIQLLDDPDETIFREIRSKLMEFGEDVIPVLEEAWEDQAMGTLYMDRIEDIIHAIQFENTFNQLANWSASGGRNLLDGVFLLTKFHFPEMDESHYRNEIKKIKQEIWLELNDHLTAYEKVRVINHIFFDVHGFTGNTDDFHSPNNSYINEVLDSKKGNPLSLSILYSAIAQELGLPIYGVNLPRHFILAYKDDMDWTPIELAYDVLFYINPFSKGSVMSKREIDHFLEQLKLEPKDTFYKPATNKQILVRMVHNLIYSYKQLKQPEKVNELEQIKSLFLSSEG